MGRFKTWPHKVEELRVFENDQPCEIRSPPRSLRSARPRRLPRPAVPPGSARRSTWSRSSSTACTLDFVRDGKIVGRAQPATPSPDARGRLAYVGGVPSGGFPPGSYEVRLTLSQGAEKATASTRLELVP